MMINIIKLLLPVFSSAKFHILEITIVLRNNMTDWTKKW